MNNRKSRLFSKKDKLNLFLILCIALFAIFAIYIVSVPKKTDVARTNISNSEIAQNDNIFDKELDVNGSVIDNAVQVKDQDLQKKNEETQDKEAVNRNEMVSSNSIQESKNLNISQIEIEDAVQVSNDSNITFVSPVDGNIIRDYTSDTIFSKTLNTWRTKEGIDFKAEVGTPVMAVLDGTVEKIDNDLTERGQYIVIKHDGGFKTVYTNLDEEVKVVSGQKIRKGEVIASIGNSAGNYSNEDYGSHFNFIMYLNNEEVNPSEYIKFK